MAIHLMELGGAVEEAGTEMHPMAEINVTPFVDVMLVLLIVFMVTAPLMMLQ
jgi:biopolymer transport protein TolR